MKSIQFLTDNDGKRIAAVIRMKQFEKLLEELEDLQDVAAYDKAKASGEAAIPYEQAIAKIRHSAGVQTNDAKKADD
ncbi:MAG TPA: hypothetical protein VJW51_01450 [Candidatus Acidoferrales bacterium]|nr:hypothetical protein [Candidatus Acidoferrales bacterium]